VLHELVYSRVLHDLNSSKQADLESSAKCNAQATCIADSLLLQQPI